MVGNYFCKTNLGGPQQKTITIPAICGPVLTGLKNEMLMTLTKRIELLVRLGPYMQGEADAWQRAKRKAYLDNNWFTDEFIHLAINNLVTQLLQPEALRHMALRYAIPEKQTMPKKVGVVMAGNIPLVGFHDFLCVFLSGHKALLKPSSKDEALIAQLVKLLHQWEPASTEWIAILPLLKNCDAYIATGSDNSSRYFEHYFSKYPHIIRKNRTSVAVLTGTETNEQLERLADDIHQYFGMGCRNVTKLYVPEGYDFVPLLDALRKYNYLIDHNKYKNNYDYQLAAKIINNEFYMTNGSVLLIENKTPFAPISQVHYEFYKDASEVQSQLAADEAIQCITGTDTIPFGGAQTPGICDFADGVDIMRFLLSL